MSGVSSDNVQVYLDESGSRDDRRHHRRSKKKHRRRSRSSSSSESSRPSSPPPRVHINPIIANSIIDAQRLQERVTAQDFQIHQMQAEYTSACARINVIEGELRRAIDDRLAANQRVFFLESQNKQLTKSQNDIKTVITTLEAGITSLRAEKEQLERAKEEAILKHQVTADEMRLVTNASQAAKEQMEFVAKRNEILSRKCEEYVAKCKKLEEEKTNLVEQVNSNRSEVDKLTISLSTETKRAEKAETEAATLSTERNALADRESVWRVEKAEMERKIIYKESQLRSEKRQHEDDIRAAQEKYSQLETKLRQQSSASKSDIAVSTLKETLRVLKKEMEDQMIYMRRRVERETDLHIEKVSSPSPSTSVPRPNKILSPSPIDKKKKKT